MKSTLLLFSLITLGTLSLSADDSKPADGFVDKLTKDTNITIHDPTNLSAGFTSDGMTISIISAAGGEWYWSNGAGYSYENNNNLAFPLSPDSKQNKLIITVTSITAGSTLKVGAFFFNGQALMSGKNQVLGADKGGINITVPGTYEFDVNAAAKTEGVTGATGWKADFWYSPEGSTGQAVTLSSLSASTSTSTPSSNSP